MPGVLLGMWMRVSQGNPLNCLLRTTFGYDRCLCEEQTNFPFINYYRVPYINSFTYSSGQTKIVLGKCIIRHHIPPVGSFPVFPWKQFHCLSVAGDSVSSQDIARTVIAFVTKRHLMFRFVRRKKNVWFKKNINLWSQFIMLIPLYPNNIVSSVCLLSF